MYNKVISQELYQAAH